MPLQLEAFISSGPRIGQIVFIDLNPDGGIPWQITLRNPVAGHDDHQNTPIQLTTVAYGTPGSTTYKLSRWGQHLPERPPEHVELVYLAWERH